ncbi:hypothetical protein SBY92_005297 [Candida maltosa Xu316]|uniref:Uncharacterized protein n=1 Tax=Candida maltosa (strain Xu316) TaxID=1245528 RepID=M3JWN8_CANMX|nr:hypothetical protein G210_2919 [Candida maltosa Xu316]
MVKTPYKRQKIASRSSNINTDAPPFPPTKYEESKATLKYFPSSIVNGITVEGGLYSLTFKSINCSKYVENNDLMKKALKVTELDLPRISEVDLNKLKEKLVNDVESEKQVKSNNGTSDDLGRLSSGLQDVLESGNGVSEFKERLHESIGGDVKVGGCNYKTVVDVKIPGLKVDSIDDVENPDLSVYEKAPKVKEEEEEKQEGDDEDVILTEEVEAV